MNPPTTNESITLVLAIAALLGPIVFGFAVWKMSQIFVSKEKFTDYSTVAERDRANMQSQLSQIGNKVDMLLDRTARLQRRNDQIDSDTS